MFRLVAFHYPKPEHRQQMVARLRRAAQFCKTTPGCLDADSWIEESGDGVVATGTWESKEECQRAFAGMTQAGIDWQYDHREARPRLVYSLIEPD